MLDHLPCWINDTHSANMQPQSSSEKYNQNMCPKPLKKTKKPKHFYYYFIIIKLKKNSSCRLRFPDDEVHTNWSECKRPKSTDYYRALSPTHAPRRPCHQSAPRLRPRQLFFPLAQRARHDFPTLGATGVSFGNKSLHYWEW